MDEVTAEKMETWLKHFTVQVAQQVLFSLELGGAS